MSALTEALCQAHGWLAADLARRWASSYGTRAWRLLDNVHCLMELGENFGAGLYAREVDYLCDEEWALDAEDILSAADQARPAARPDAETEAGARSGRQDWRAPAQGEVGGARTPGRPPGPARRDQGNGTPALAGCARNAAAAWPALVLALA